LGEYYVDLNDDDDIVAFKKSLSEARKKKGLLNILLLRPYTSETEVESLIGSTEKATQFFI